MTKSSHNHVPQPEERMNGVLKVWVLLFWKIKMNKMSSFVSHPLGVMENICSQKREIRQKEMMGKASF